MSQVQAAEIRIGSSVVWGVQYHPEYRLRRGGRHGAPLRADSGRRRLLRLARAELEAYANDVSVLHADASRRDIAWRLDLGPEILVEEERVREIANWVELQVRKHSRA